MLKTNIIHLPARYGLNHTLVYMGQHLWRLDLDPKSTGTYRIIGNINNIQAIDPEGGPFLSVGDKIENKTIKSISSFGIIELE